MVCAGAVKIQATTGTVDLVLGLGKNNFRWKLSVFITLGSVHGHSQQCLSGWYGTPPYYDVLPIEINNKIKHYFINIFFLFFELEVESRWGFWSNIVKFEIGESI